MRICVRIIIYSSRHLSDYIMKLKTPKCTKHCNTNVICFKII